MTIDGTPEVEVAAVGEHQGARRSIILGMVGQERGEQLRQSLRHPHLESLEMAEADLAAWAEGLPNDGSDLIAPGVGEEVVWTADRGWVGTDG